MPLLKREAEMSHPDLFELSEAELPWWDAHTRSQQEKALARFLRPLEIPFFVPQREKKARTSGRIRVSYIPLFPGYGFFRGPAAAPPSDLGSGVLAPVRVVADQRRPH